MMEQENQGNQNNTPSPHDLLKMAADGGAIDRTRLGINTPRTSDGLQVFNEGFDFLQFDIFRPNKNSK